MSDVAERLLVDTHGRRAAFGAPVSGLAWAGGCAWFALGDGRVCGETLGVAAHAFDAHGGAALCIAPHPDGRGVLTGGDDGRLVRTDADGVAEVAALGPKWVHHVIASPASGLVVAAVGKDAVVFPPRNPPHRFTLPSSVGGLALDAKGKRLAATHYGGATLLWAATPGSGRHEMRWAGSHLDCTLSPDGKYLVSALQEAGLHGWRLPLGTDMAMRGYKAKTRSFSWNRRARWLATSGDTAAICWPFDGPVGPMNRRPLLVGQTEEVVTRVAFHPEQDVLALGYADGLVALAQLNSEGLVPIDIAPDGHGDARVTALAWKADGSALAWGRDDGGGGLIDMTKRA